MRLLLILSAAAFFLEASALRSHSAMRHSAPSPPSAMHLRGGVTEERPHRCSICGKNFPQSGKLDCSQSGNEETHKCLCMTCGKFFAPDLLPTHECVFPKDGPAHVYDSYALGHSGLTRPPPSEEPQ
ncbi:hypothetical protein T484DRAFT_1794830 [Baffinella frigidus]|nr:hypothetical protein T484DRAFT_1794830 [Cryptophyta sp. CCMP2293]